MKKWKVNRIIYRGSSPLFTSGDDYEADKLEKYLNELEAAGCHIEGVEFHTNDKATIISSIEIKKPEGRSKEDFWICDDCGAQLPDCMCPPNMG